MSYEGHVQCICPTGHYFTADAYDKAVCDECGCPAAWSNGVDDTNCDSNGEIPLDLLIKHYQVTPEEYRTCDMGHSHRVQEPVFRIPTQEETEALRHYRPAYGNSPLVPLPRSRSEKETP